MLEVRIAEMSKTAIDRFGINWSWINNGDFAANLIGGLSTFALGAVGVPRSDDSFSDDQYPGPIPDVHLGGSLFWLLLIHEACWFI